MRKISNQQQKSISGGAHVWNGLAQHKNIVSTKKTVTSSFYTGMHTYSGTWGRISSVGNGVGRYSTSGYKQTCYCW